MSKNIAEQYLKEVTDNIVCESGAKRFVRNELKQSLASYTEENATFTMDDLYGEFGSPKEFAVQFSDRKDFPEILKKAKKKSILWKCLGILGIALAIAVAIGAYFIIKEFTATVRVTNPIPQIEFLRGNYI